MSAPFEDRLWAQLEAAAERELLRGGRRRWLARLHDIRWLLPAGALAVILAGLVAVLASSPSPPPAAAIRVLPVGGSPTAAVAAGGAAWLYDSRADRLLELDARDGRVTHTVPIHDSTALVALAGTGDSLWVAPTPWLGHAAPERIGEPVTLRRIDAGSRRIVARIPLRAPHGAALVPFGMATAGEDVWVWGRGGALRIDPATNRVVDSIAIPDDVVYGFAATAGTVWLATESGRLERYDARSGRRVGVSAITPVRRQIDLVTAGGTLVLEGNDGTLHGLDPATGRARWHTRVGGSIGALTASAGRVWLAAENPTGAHHDLVLLDPATGRILSRRALPLGTAQAIVVVGSALWVVLDRGAIAVLRE
jgi:outer membrane protein assembly factor BamB